MSTGSRFNTDTKPDPKTVAALSKGRFSEAYSILKNAITTQAFPGCAFGVSTRDRVLLQDGLGRFTYDSHAKPISMETVFDVASLTKVLGTTAACMLLYQRGLLDLELPLGDVLPAFVIGRDSSKWARSVTIQHLLSHSSGLPGYVPLFQTENSSANLLRACLSLPIEAEPGTRAEYSDPGFILLGKALEAVTGELLSDFLQREIFSPLGLINTGYCPRSVLLESIPPTEMDNSFRHRLIQGEVQDENAYRLKGVAGHAGIFSNVPDILRFSAAILAANQDSLFHPGTVDFFARRQPPAGSSRALGWDTPSQDSSSGSFFASRSIGHLGYSGCSLWIDREADIAVVLLTNRSWPNRESQQIRSVRPAFHNAIRQAIMSL